MTIEKKPYYNSDEKLRCSIWIIEINFNSKNVTERKKNDFICYCSSYDAINL